MACNIITHFNGAKIKKTNTIGIAYRIFKDNKLLCEGRNAFIGMTNETRKYASLNELLKCIIKEQEYGNIPQGSHITFVGDSDVLTNFKNGSYAKGIQKSVIKEIKESILKLKEHNYFKYIQRDDELSYCNTKIPHYLSKLAFLSALELRRFQEKIKNVDELLEIVRLQKQLGIVNQMDFKQATLKSNSHDVLKQNYFLKYNIVISDHCFKRWKERVIHVENKEEILKYILESAVLNNGISHEYEDFYCLQNEIICIAVFNENQICFKTVYGAISKNTVLSKISYFKNDIHKYGKLNLN